MLFSELKTHVSKNLADAGEVYFSSTDLRDSFQDGYDDIVSLTQCIIKKATLFFTDQPYYDFKALGVTDFLAVVAIFNNNTNAWLEDNFTLHDFDMLRDDWEVWNGAPQYWAAVNFQYTAIVPKKFSGTFDLYYWATAPTVVDAAVPLVPTDLQKLFEFYSTPDLLEQAEEYTKASVYWEMYFQLIEICKERTMNLARTDLTRLR